jgi:predicted RNA-binding Zn-ribbon protein involved in translation (DUF1610 family)
MGRMTVDNRTTVEPRDIVSVETECASCHAKQTVPVAEFHRVLEKCPNCGEGLVSSSHSRGDRPSDAHLLYQFIESLKRVQEFSEKTIVRLELRPNPS